MPNKFIFRKSLKYAKILLGIHLIQKYGFSICITDGPSMIPTIGPKRELLLYEKLSISLSRIFKLNGNFPVNRNDIIIANSVENPEILVCKRVIAKEGDIVTVFPNYTLVSKFNNCNFIDFIHKPHSCFQMKIPPNYFWIQGDNFNNSRDSRNYGPIHESLIIGRVIYKLWPNPIFSKLSAIIRRKMDQINTLEN
ncbi:Peptidase S26A signal peptidase I [Cryptosporidium hominis]|uniref:Mitochondrial inner membrane protease subunit n=1 Tax=Cryptosporidium hominis TaxID=237895 RepID=A0ABX5B9G9_CRYHO|nr:Peptidase S26A signal peptidase I [Cryptosporidium hominis]|eukprot:PPS93112.1 Peptidase S26A signal peptidase I [Cryptosporidium hominis]